MVTIRPRAAWQRPSQPVTGPAYPTATVRDVVYHYPGSPAGTGYPDPAASLRAMQNDYLTSRGYSLGYNFVIDPPGIVWQVRGVDIKSAATGGYNDHSVAVQFLVPGQQRANGAQIASAVQLHRWLEAHHGRPLGVAGHYQRGTTATPCPGDGIKSQLPEIERLVRAPTTPPEDPMFIVRDKVTGDIWYSNGAFRYHYPSFEAYQAAVFVAAQHGRPLPDPVDIDPAQLAGFGVAIGA